MTKKDARVTVCMTHEDKARLEAQAQKEGRSVANLIHKGSLGGRRPLERKLHWGRLPPKRVFGYFLHEQKVTPRRVRRQSIFTVPEDTV